MKLPAITAFTIAVLALGAGAAPLAIGAETRIVSLDAGTTETLYALGVGDRVVARDSGSTYPESAQSLPVISDGHQINVEAVLAERPTLVIGRNRAMSGPGMHLLEQAHVDVVRVPDEPGVDIAKERIDVLGQLLGKQDRAAELKNAIDEDMGELERAVKEMGDQPKPSVLVLYLRPGVAMMMGEDSNAAAMVELAQGSFAIPGLEGYKTLNPEAVVAAQPDVILCYADGLEASGGVDALLQRPGIKETPAGKNKRIVAMDDVLLSGFGPRTGEAALTLWKRLYQPRDAVAMANP